MIETRPRQDTCSWNYMLSLPNDNFRLTEIGEILFGPGKKLILPMFRLGALVVILPGARKSLSKITSSSTW